MSYQKVLKPATAQLCCEQMLKKGGTINKIKLFELPVSILTKDMKIILNES